MRPKLFLLIFFNVVIQIEAHGGSVNDLAFSYPNKQLSVVTCGDDRAIKVWFFVIAVKVMQRLALVIMIYVSTGVGCSYRD